MQKFFLKWMMALLCVVFLTGCNEEAKLQKVTPKETDAFAREFIAALQKKNLDQAEKMIEPKVRAEAKPKLKNMTQLFESGAIEQVKLLGVQIRQGPDQKMIQLNYQIYFKQAWLVASLAILETAKERHVVSVRMDSLKLPLEKIYAFKLSGKSFFHYLFLMVAILIPAFIAYVLYQCIRMPVAFKWLWIPFILLGLASLHLDWASGRIFFQPIHVLVFGVMFFKQKFSPLILSVGLPVGALVFFFLHLFKYPKKSMTAAL